VHPDLDYVRVEQDGEFYYLAEQQLPLLKALKGRDKGDYRVTETLKGKSRAEALVLLDKFHELLTTETEAANDLGKLVVFCGVREYPARVKCATLAWHTLKSALAGSTAEPVSTE